VRERRTAGNEQGPAPPAKAPRTAHVVDPGGRVFSSVLALQRAGGNRATARLLRQPAPTRRLQRKLTGLREATPTSTFTKAAVDFWKDAANKGRSLDDFARHLIAKANAELKLLKSHEMKPAFAAIPSPGNFDSMSWTVTMNTALFSSRSGVNKVEDLNLDEAAEAKNWRSATSGLHRGYKNVVNVWDMETRAAGSVSYDLPALTGAKAGLETWLKKWRGADRLKFIESHLKAVKAVKSKSGVDTVALTNMKAIRAAMVKLEKAWTKVTAAGPRLSPRRS
jgi:hypothetical protein